MTKSRKESVKICPKISEKYEKILKNKDKLENYNFLIGHVVYNDEDSAIITGITNIGDINNERYIYLIANRHMEGNNNIINIGKYCKEYNYNTGATDVITDNIEGHNVAQSLKMKTTGKVWGCKLNLSTYACEKYNATVKYNIKNENGCLLQEGYAVADNIEDNKYSTVYFEEPIEVYKDQVIMLSFVYDNDKNYPLSMKVSDNDSYEDGTMYLDEKELEGKDMGIKILMVKE